MAIDPRRRQRKLERKRAKKTAERRELARREAGGLAVRIEQGSKAPILHCFATSNVLKDGIGEVLISRQLSHGNVAFVIFLVDMYCLGVKDVVVNIVPEAHYRKNVYEKLGAQDHVGPAEARVRPQAGRRARCSMPSTWNCRRTPTTASPGGSSAIFPRRRAARNSPTARTASPCSSPARTTMRPSASGSFTSWRNTAAPADRTSSCRCRARS